MLYSTCLPVSMATLSAMALDAAGNVYVIGTSSTGHVAIVKLSPDGSAFVYYQELAGSGQDAGRATPSGTPPCNFEVGPSWNLFVGSGSHGMENPLGATIVVK